MKANVGWSLLEGFYCNDDCTCAQYPSILRKLRKKETSKFHVQMCIAIFCMLLFFLIGIDRTENDISCTFFSLLIQYFSMASVAWMGAEAVLMFHKMIIVFGQIQLVHLVIISIIAWGNEISKNGLHNRVTCIGY